MSSAVAPNIKVIQSICRSDRLKYEVEYGMRRGTTDNSYLVTVGAMGRGDEWGKDEGERGGSAARSGSAAR